MPFVLGLFVCLILRTLFSLFVFLIVPIHPFRMFSNPHTWFSYSFKDDPYWRFFLIIFSSHSSFSKYFHQFSFETTFSEFFYSYRYPLPNDLLVLVFLIHTLWRFLSIGSLFACIFFFEYLTFIQNSFFRIFLFLPLSLFEWIFVLCMNKWLISKKFFFVSIFCTFIIADNFSFTINWNFWHNYWNFKKRWAEAHRIHSWMALYTGVNPVFSILDTG